MAFLLIPGVLYI